MVIQGKGARSYCPCSELDPSLQQLWWLVRLPAPSQRWFSRRALCRGEIEPTLHLIPSLCVGSLEHCGGSQELGAGPHSTVNKVGAQEQLSLSRS